MKSDILNQIEVANANKRFKILNANDPVNDIPNEIWNNPNYVVERKLDGHRFKLFFFDDKNRLDSRRQSSVDGLYVEKTDNVPHIRDYVVSDLSGTILDGELIAGSDSNSVAHALGSLATDAERNTLKYVAFDILFFKNIDVRNQSDNKRRKLLETIFKHKQLQSSKHILLMPRKHVMLPTEKKLVLINAMNAGEEGVMIKDTTKPYGEGWIKVKREARYDVVVMGYTDPKQMSLKKGDSHETKTKYAELGLIGAIIFGQYVNGQLVEFGQCSGMSDEIRTDVSKDKKKYIGCVFEIAAQERFETGKFRHPRFIRWRDDKSKHDCVYRTDEA